ncbi:NAD-dependent epimerase/dehydratase family protein [Croceivirga thetidis]|uniref:NAD-dependent epimerase/dehydratase family protein n=1 Tax=Croceivirga thetidis TaxID=2721623 RepID=A0ABX1GNV1_9FLAO|nr:NAD-dependent epimerase/dehydratase family protein [Croceivirga thetidis]NKI31588.1 NAD-dependent epimerase/dehydratase family protein [Croceivirga thetidis]
MTLVTGASGLVGAHLLLKLVQKNVKVRALYRTESKLETVKRIFGYYVDNPDQIFDKITWMACDITDVPTLERAFENIEQVYHCAAYISFDPNHYKKLQKSNVEGTANVVNLCIEKAVNKLCYVSSIAAIGSKGSQPITETTEFNPTDASVYALTKNAAELEVWRGTQEGIPAVIVNPGVILGPGQWNQGSGTFFSKNSKPQKYFLPGGTGFVGIDDVVDSMMSLMESEISNERFILVSENLSFKEIQSRIAKAFGTKPPTKAIKQWQLELFWRLDWLRNKLVGSRRILSKAMTKSLQSEDTYSKEKIEMALGSTLRPLDDMITFCCSAYQQDNSSY